MVTALDPTGLFEEVDINVSETSVWGDGRSVSVPEARDDTGGSKFCALAPEPDASVAISASERARSYTTTSSMSPAKLLATRPISTLVEGLTDEIGSVESDALSTPST